LHAWSGPSSPTSAPQAPQLRNSKAVRLLVLGGTKFLGRAVVECALQRGHAVTLFNRGHTNPDLFPEAERLRGDREGDLDFLRGRDWDAVVDPSGYVPSVVRRSAELLADAVDHYVFISSVSVYGDFSGPLREGDPLAELDPEHSAEELREDYANYGSLKALCEDVVVDVFPDRHTNIRAGLLVGPHDPTGRFTYWPHRFARGGDVLAPAPPDRTVQFIDVRDLGTWIVVLCESRAVGTFNATHPGVPWGELLEACRRVLSDAARIVWVPDAFLMEQHVVEWTELPLWIGDPQWLGLHEADVSRALAAGLTFRPLDNTVRGAFERSQPTPDAGLTQEREAELLETWHSREGRPTPSP
jgi:nucleoside-diphosphate-sugar epimerase